MTRWQLRQNGNFFLCYILYFFYSWTRSWRRRVGSRFLQRKGQKKWLFRFLLSSFAPSNACNVDVPIKFQKSGCTRQQLAENSVWLDKRKAKLLLLANQCARGEGRKKNQQRRWVLSSVSFLWAHKASLSNCKPRKKKHHDHVQTPSCGHWTKITHFDNGWKRVCRIYSRSRQTRFCREAWAP